MKNPKGGSSPKTARPSKVSLSPEPPFEVTAPRYSDEWMEQINTRHEMQALEAARSPFEGRRFKPFQKTASAPAKTKRAKP